MIINWLPFLSITYNIHELIIRFACSISYTFWCHEFVFWSIPHFCSSLRWSKPIYICTEDHQPALIFNLNFCLNIFMCVLFVDYWICVQYFPQNGNQTACFFLSHTKLFNFWYSYSRYSLFFFWNPAMMMKTRYPLYFCLLLSILLLFHMIIHFVQSYTAPIHTSTYVLMYT